MKMVSSSSQDSHGLEEKMREEMAKNQAAMGLLSLSSVREGTFRNRSPTLPTSTESTHRWSKTEEENAMLKMQLSNMDSLLKDMHHSILDFCLHQLTLLDMLPTTGQWSEDMRQDLIYRVNALKLELEPAKSAEHDLKKYQEKIKLVLKCLGNAMKSITEGPHNNNDGTVEVETDDVGLGGDMVYEMLNHATISIDGALPSPPPPPPPASTVIIEGLITSAADQRDSEDEQATTPEIEEHVIDKSKAKWGFICTCSMEFRCKENLIHHIKVRSLPNGVNTACTTCKVCFPSTEEYISHRKSVHKISPRPTDLEKVSLNQAPVRHFHGCQVNSLDNVPSSNCPDFDDSSIQELIQIGGPPSRPLHAVDRTQLGFCCICGLTCSNRNALQHHIWYRSNLHKIKCDFCPRAYPGYSYLHRHQYSAHKYTPPSFPNTDGVVIVSAKQNLSSEVNSGTSSPEFSCSRQPIQNHSSSGAALTTARASRRCHGINTSKQQNGIFPCLCKEKFKSPRSLQKHIQMFARDPVLPCKLCNTRFYNVKYLKRHIRKIHRLSSDGFMKGCYDCGVVFEEAHEYTEHRKYVHKSGPLYGINLVRGANKRKQAKPDEVKHGLSVLPEVVDLEPEDDNSATSDDRSDSGSSSSSPPACHCKCGKSFSTMSALEAHARDSATKLMFRCDCCPKRFNSHAGLKSHMSRSHKEKNYNNKYGCNKCGKTFQTRQQLMNHIQHVHPQPRLFPFQVATSEFAAAQA